MAVTKAKPETWLHHNDKLLRIQKWCRDGLTKSQMAANIGISLRTFNRWLDLEVIPEPTDLPYKRINFKGTFAEFIIHAREVDDEIIGALRMAATGYWIEEEYMDKKGNPKKVKRWIPPSDKALALWLKNRLPAEWNRENEGDAENKELQENRAIDFFVRQKVQIDDMQNQNSEVEINADGTDN